MKSSYDVHVASGDLVLHVVLLRRFQVFLVVKWIPRGH